MERSLQTMIREWLTFECQICKVEYNFVDISPYQICSNHHVICWKCVVNIMKNSKRVCPFDRVKIKQENINPISVPQMIHRAINSLISQTKRVDKKNSTLFKELAEKLKSRNEKLKKSIQKNGKLQQLNRSLSQKVKESQIKAKNNSISYELKLANLYSLLKSQENQLKKVSKEGDELKKSYQSLLQHLKDLEQKNKQNNSQKLKQRHMELLKSLQVILKTAIGNLHDELKEKNQKLAKQLKDSQQKMKNKQKDYELLKQQLDKLKRFRNLSSQKQLGNNYLQREIKNMDEKSLIKFFQQYENFPNLQKIILCQKKITNEGWKILINNIYDCFNLKQIHFSNNRITDQGLKYFVQQVPYYPDLRVLDFQFNLIEDQGLKSLSMHAFKFNKLQALYLKENEITNEGLRFLTESTHNNFKSLLRIGFQYNHITDKGLTYLVSNGLKFPKLENINLIGNLVTAVGVKILTQKNQSNTLINLRQVHFDSQQSHGFFRLFNLKC